MKQQERDERPVLVYCRESRDEFQADYERIETQREMLLAFCRRRGLVNIADVVLDDGKSGTDFHRFDRILPRIERGEIRVLVCKDASRLGRNLKESLIFVDRLEECGAEILFESEEYHEDFFPLKAWFNEQRAKEDSRKIRRVLRYKMETGELLIKPVYGYRRSADGAMVPHPETGTVVAEIFRLAAQGHSTGEIAHLLNRRAVPTPSQAAGLQHCAAQWNRQHIRRILSNPVYLGTMVYNRTGRKSFKNSRTIRKPESEWIILPAHHPALVTPEQFAAAQKGHNKNGSSISDKKS